MKCNDYYIIKILPPAGYEEYKGYSDFLFHMSYILTGKTKEEHLEDYGQICKDQILWNTLNYCYTIAERDFGIIFERNSGRDLKEKWNYLFIPKKHKDIYDKLIPEITYKYKILNRIIFFHNTIDHHKWRLNLSLLNHVEYMN